MPEFGTKKKTISYNELSITTVTKLNDQNDVNLENIKLPKIIVRDRFGIKLHTETTYQNKIAYERLRLKNNLFDSNESKTYEWIPHAPVPSKPDYSRVKYQYNIKNRYFSLRQTFCTEENIFLNGDKKAAKYIDFNTFDIDVIKISRYFLLMFQLSKFVTLLAAVTFIPLLNKNHLITDITKFLMFQILRTRKADTHVIKMFLIFFSDLSINIESTQLIIN